MIEISYNVVHHELQLLADHLSRQRIKTSTSGSASRQKSSCWHGPYLVRWLKHLPEVVEHDIAVVCWHGPLPRQRIETRNNHWGRNNWCPESARSLISLKDWSNFAFNLSAKVVVVSWHDPYLVRGLKPPRCIDNLRPVNLRVCMAPYLVRGLKPAADKVLVTFWDRKLAWFLPRKRIETNSQELHAAHSGSTLV